MENARCVLDSDRRAQCTHLASGYQGSTFIRTASVGFEAMAPFVVQRDSPLPPAEAWARVTDWRRHARWVPLTAIDVPTPPPNGVGTVFVARTGLRRRGFDDPMEVVQWDPPRFCRIEKRGRVMLGWAELSIEQLGAGSRVTWREEAVPAKLPAFARGVSQAAGKILFARVLRGLLVD
jgi:polyketide cyclase/dehydrase/lipid transport protein